MMDLHAHYLRYLARLDAREFDALAPFVAESVTHNGRTMTRDDYGAMIAAIVEPVPDLRFHPELVVVTGDTLAARLTFRCTPLRPFLGLVPSGGTVHFAEHAFYRFAERRIVEVWSLVDRAAVEAQLGG